MLSVSATIPWPAKAASPCMSSGKTLRRCSVSPRMRCRARAVPSTTGSTASRMARIGREPNLDFRAGSEFPDGVIAEVIFHVAIARDEIGNVVCAELGEDHLERFLEEIREHIEPAAMRHPHANFLDPVARAAMQNRVEDDHERFRALERKALLPDVAGVQKKLRTLPIRGAAAGARSPPVSKPDVSRGVTRSAPAPSCGCAGSGCAETRCRWRRRRFSSSVAIIARSVIFLFSRKNFDETCRSRSFSLKPSSRRVSSGFSGRLSASGFTRAIVCPRVR